jgi:hypothetical protein
MRQLNTVLLHAARAIKHEPRSYDLANDEIIKVRHLADGGMCLREIMEVLGWDDRPMQYCRMVLRERYRIRPKASRNFIRRGELEPAYHDPKSWRPKPVKR